MRGEKKKVADAESATLIEGSRRRSTLFDVGLFEAEVLLLVHYAEVEGDEACGDTKGGQHDEGPGVVELGGGGAFGVGAVEHFADEQGEEPEANVLNPENQGVG